MPKSNTPASGNLHDCIYSRVSEDKDFKHWDSYAVVGGKIVGHTVNFHREESVRLCRSQYGLWDVPEYAKCSLKDLEWLYRTRDFDMDYDQFYRCQHQPIAK
jgi:hypothetical protein